MSSCEEQPTTIGTSLLPGSDFVSIKGTDTLSVMSYTMYDDSIRSDNPTVSYLGEIYDPYFGTTSAEFVTQIRLAQKWENLPNMTVDSVKLFLKLLDVKGGSDAIHTLKISEIAEQIFTTSKYYSNKQIPLSGFEASDIVLPVLKPDTINFTVISLPLRFGEYLIRDTTKLKYDNSETDFKSYFKGLNFSILSSSDPLFVSLSVAPPAAGSASTNAIVVYMHGTDNVAVGFSFVLDAVNRNASFNKFSHNYGTANPDKRIKHINDGYRDTLSYLQYLYGLYSKIEIPGLEDLKNDPSFKNIAINKARLTVPVYFDGDIYKPSTSPEQLYLRFKTTSGLKINVPDLIMGGNLNFFNGKIDTTANLYTFNIPGFIQEYLKDTSGEYKPELEIFQGDGTENVIFRANSSKIPIKLELTYTKF